MTSRGLKEVAFDLNTKNVGNGCFHLRTGDGKEDQYVEEQELVVCSCIFYFVYSCMLSKILFIICCRTVLRMVTTMREGFNLSFDLEMVASYLQTKNV